MKYRLIVGVILAVVFFGALVYFHGPGQVPPGQAPLENLTAQNVSDLRTAFNAAKDETRVLLLLSPT